MARKTKTNKLEASYGITAFHMGKMHLLNPTPFQKHQSCGSHQLFLHCRNNDMGCTCSSFSLLKQLNRPVGYRWTSNVGMESVPVFFSLCYSTCNYSICLFFWPANPSNKHICIFLLQLKKNLTLFIFFYTN